LGEKWQKNGKKSRKNGKNGPKMVFFRKKTGKNAVKREIFGVAGFGFQTVDTGAGA